MARRGSKNNTLTIGLAICGVIAALGIISLRFIQPDPAPPPPPKQPVRTDTNVNTLLRFTPAYFKAVLDEDAKRFSIPLMEIAQLAEPFVFRTELREARTLKADRDGVETERLKISTKVQKEWATNASGQGFRFEHMILVITNKTDSPMAYRIVTDVEDPVKCKSKGALGHNAIAILPHETLERTECLWKPGATLTIRRIDAMTLPMLSYHYVTRLIPGQILLDERSAAGHESARAKPCTFVPWRDIQRSAEAGRAAWEDIIDFYARHNCDEYSFYGGYKRWTAPGVLPSHLVADPAVATP